MEQSSRKIRTEPKVGSQLDVTEQSELNEFPAESIKNKQISSKAKKRHEMLKEKFFLQEDYIDIFDTYSPDSDKKS